MMEEDENMASVANYAKRTLTIDTLSILGDIKKHWWNILITLLAGGMLAYVLAINLAQPVYRSNAVFAVLGNRGSSVSNVQNASRFSGAIVNVLASDTFRDLVAAQVGTTDFDLTASYIEDTNFISITAMADTPYLAFQTLKVTQQQYPALLSDLMADLYVVDVQKAEVPVEPINGYNAYYSSAIGAAIAGLFYLALVVLLSVLRETVKNSSDMRHKVDARLLGTVPYISQKKGKDGALLLSSANHNFHFEESYQLIASRILSQMEEDGRKVLAVTSVLQNEGKTHCIANLAYAISKGQRKVLVLDCDFRNPSIAKLLSPREQYANALGDALRLGNVTNEMLYKYPNSNVYVLTNQKRINNYSQLLSNGNFRHLLQVVATHFDFILVDTGPMVLVADTAVIASQCDSTVLLVSQDIAVVPAINDALDELDRMGNVLGCIYRETRPSRDTFPNYGYSQSYGYGNGARGEKEARE